MPLKNVLPLALWVLGACGGSTSTSTGDAAQPSTVNACIGVECAPPTACQNPGVCDPATGQCTYSPRPDGQDCDDDNACTLGDGCRAGVCVGGPAQTCIATDQCHGAGTCDPKTGCSNVALADGTGCDDSNLCTQGDTCQSGLCAGTPLPCTGGDQCTPTGQCNAGTGKCEYLAAPQGTPCTLYAGTPDETPSYCTAGVCQSTCAVGYTDCNHDEITDGCEVFTGGDPDNCGGCGVSCSASHVTVRACAEGNCSGTCVAGYADCDGAASNTGCQTVLATDALNCGGCGIACKTPGTANMATSSCVSGTCAGTCAPQFGDCNANLATDGCEANFNTDPHNCGMCGRQCPNAASTCVNGNCYRGSFKIGDGPSAASNPMTLDCQEACAQVFGQESDSWEWQCSTASSSVNFMTNAVDREFFPDSGVGYRKCIVTDDEDAMGSTWGGWIGSEVRSTYVNDPDPSFDSCRSLPNYCFDVERGPVE